jgi:predicted Mrr-cat superfamily restriction endonuclease
VVRVWVVRGGEKNRLVDEFIDNNVIGVGFRSVPDGRTVTESALEAILRADNHGSPRQRAERFQDFVWEMSPGDVIVMPDTPRGEVVIGEITGDYKYREDLPADRYRHRRDGRWLGRHPHSDLPRGREGLYRQRQSMRELLDAADLVEHANRVRRGEVGRPATERRQRTAKKA